MPFRFLAAPLITLGFALSGQAAAPAPQWQCLDRSGVKVLQERPCGDGTVEWQTTALPAYVWGIVAMLGIVWLVALMPQRMMMRWRSATPAMPELLPAGLPPLAEGLESTPDAAAAAPEPAPAPAPARPAAWSLDAIIKLSPRRFEELVHALWQANGYKPVLNGIDVNIHNASTGRLFAIARGAPAGQPVRVGTVQGLWRLVQQHEAALGVCYGASGFALDALAFAEGKRLKLVSGAELLAHLRTLKPERQQLLLEHVWRT